MPRDVEERIKLSWFALPSQGMSEDTRIMGRKNILSPRQARQWWEHVDLVLCLMADSPSWKFQAGAYPRHSAGEAACPSIGSIRKA